MVDGAGSALYYVDADGNQHLFNDFLTGIAASTSDANRLVKAGSVEVNGQKVTEFITLAFPGEYVIRVGKKWKKVTG